MSDRSGSDHSRIVNHALVPPVGTFEIDPVHTFVGFSAQHLVVGRARGRFEAVRGTIIVADDPSASTVEVSIDTASITTLNSIRDDDLRSAHYLDVEHFSTMTFPQHSDIRADCGRMAGSGRPDAARRDSAC
jgi:polyisoprenoid-binding protein YceI